MKKRNNSRLRRIKWHRSLNCRSVSFLVEKTEEGKEKEIS